MLFPAKLQTLLRDPPRRLEAIGLPWLLRAAVVLVFYALVLGPWAGAAYLIRSVGRPESKTYLYMTGILFGVTLLGLLYVLKITLPMARHYPRLIEDRGRPNYYWRRTLPLMALLTLLTGAKFCAALLR